VRLRRQKRQAIERGGSELQERQESAPVEPEPQKRPRRLKERISSASKPSKVVVRVHRNDGGSVAEFSTGGESITCYSTQQVLQLATKRLKLSRPALRLFTPRGLELMSMEEFVNGGSGKNMFKLLFCF